MTYFSQKSVHNNIKQLLVVLVLSWLYALCSQVTIWMPFGLVPISLQPLPLYIAVMCFGNIAIYAYGAYLVQGALGAPFFAGGLSGVSRLVGPTGGYLVGFLAAMIVFSFLLGSYGKKNYLLGLFVLVSQCLVFLCGLTQLSFFIPSNMLLSMGLVPFIFGDFFLKPALCIVWTRLHKK